MPTTWTKGNPRREAAWQEAKHMMESRDMKPREKYAYMMSVAKKIAAGKERKRRARMSAHAHSMTRG